MTSELVYPSVVFAVAVVVFAAALLINESDMDRFGWASWLRGLSAGLMLALITLEIVPRLG